MIDFVLKFCSIYFSLLKKKIILKIFFLFIVKDIVGIIHY